MTRFSIIFVVLLSGCAANAQTPQASIDLNALVRKHPLYGTLAQYDRQISVLTATLHTEFANENAVMGNASAAIRRDLDHGANASRANRVDARAFPAQLPLAPRGGSTTEHNIGNALTQAYAAQRAQLRDAAAADLASYRSALAGEQDTVFRAFVAAVQRRTDRAYTARAQELREAESTLLLDQARAHASVRLQIRAKLQTLALDAVTRAHLKQRLAALQAREDAAVHQMRAAHAQTLAAYAAQLRERERSDIREMAAEISSRAQASLAARETISHQQIAGASALTIPAAHDRRGPSLNDMRAQYAGLLRAQPGSPEAMNRAGDDLTARVRSLQQANTDDTQSIESQIGWLRHDREAVRKRMIAQIFEQAQRLAHARGLSGVADLHSAKPGAVDLTGAVAAELRALSP